MKPIHALALAYVDSVRSFRLSVIRFLSKLLFKKRTDHHRILINRDGAFGDAIVALPALSIIRQNYPDAQIDLLSVTNNGISFKDLSLEDTLINTLYVIKKHQRKETLKRLKNNNYDLFIQIPQNIGLYKSTRNIFLVRFYLNINNAFGWDSGRIKAFMRLQKKYQAIPTETERFVKSLQQNALPGKLNYPIKNLTVKDKKLEELIKTSSSVAFMIGGKLQTKKWPLDHWVLLANMIQGDRKILIIGGDDEKHDAEYITSKTTNTINLCGKLNIGELYFVLKKIELAVSLDTGAMHLCDAAKTKLIVLFSTRDLSNKWFPNNKNSIVMERVLPCSFCLKTECAENICMSNISADEVFANISLLLNSEVN